MVIYVLIAMFVFFIVPIILTVLNIINLFKRKKISENIVDTLIFLLGTSFTLILCACFSSIDYTEPMIIGHEMHTPIATWSLPTVLSIVGIGILSNYIIRSKKTNLPPLISIFSLSGILISLIYMIIFLIQIINENLLENYLIYLVLFPINYILCSIRIIIKFINEYKKKDLKPQKYDNEFLNKCNKIIYNVNNWPILVIVCAIPLLIVLICILILFGQRPDEAIQAFLETSDWNLSQKIAPPPVEYQGHYLCTVSLQGHNKLVKPTRIGIRRGEKIIVNRQLCIANAFEDLIQEKTPKFHHFIRTVYDEYGLPISKYINKPWKADIVYILMKPLEWIFLIVLYLFDEKPENRIETQYIGKKLKFN